MQVWEKSGGRCLGWKAESAGGHGRRGMGSSVRAACHILQQLLVPPTLCSHPLPRPATPTPETTDKSCANFYVSSSLNDSTITGYFDTNFPSGKIRMTSLNLNRTNGPGSLLCIVMVSGTCSSYTGLCNGHDGSCL